MAQIDLIHWLRIILRLSSMWFFHFPIPLSSTQVSSHVSLLCHVSHRVSIMRKWAEEASLTVALFSADAQNALEPPGRGRWRQVPLFKSDTYKSTYFVSHLFLSVFLIHLILFCRYEQLVDSCAKMAKDVEFHLWMHSKNLQSCDAKQLDSSFYALHSSDLSYLAFQYGPSFPVTIVLCFSRSAHQQICTSITDKFSWPCKWHPIFLEKPFGPTSIFPSLLSADVLAIVSQKKKLENERD